MSFQSRVRSAINRTTLVLSLVCLAATSVLAAPKNVTALGDEQNPAQQASAVAPMPTPIEQVHPAAVGNKVYVPGDYYNDVMQIYNTTTNSWSMGSAPPEGFTGSAVAALNGKVYIMGGVGVPQLSFSPFIGGRGLAPILGPSQAQA